MNLIVEIFQRRPTPFRVPFVTKSNSRQHTRLQVTTDQSPQLVEPNEQARLPSSIAKGQWKEARDPSSDEVQPFASFQDNVVRSDTQPFQNMPYLLGAKPSQCCDEHVVELQIDVETLGIETNKVDVTYTSNVRSMISLSNSEQ